MNRWTRAWCVCWLAAAGLSAAPLLDEPVAALTLRDGTVLRQAQASGFLTKVVLVRHEEGVRTVPYELFPREFQAELARRRQAVVAAVEKEAQNLEAQRAQQTRTAPAAVGPKWDWRETCRLTLAGGTDQVVLVKIENLTDFVVSVYPWQVTARTQGGKLVAGAHWVGLNGEGQVVMTLRNRQVVEARSEVSLALAVAPGLEGDSVVAVVWR